MMRKLIAGFMFLGFAGLAYTLSPHQLCQGFFPANNFQVPIGFTNTGLSEKEFTAVMDKYEKIYSPIIAAHGGSLQLNRHWADSTVNASAQQLWGYWQIEMYGGLARFDGMTPDAMMMVVCHETGHHLGGAPRKGFFQMSWATNEGGADYFSALKCIHKVFDDEANEQIVSQMPIEPIVQQKCLSVYSQSTKDAAVCMRSGHAGLILARVLAKVRKNPVEPKIETPDQHIVDITFDEHPEAQCRLDTYFQAAICKVSANLDLDAGDYHINSCSHPTQPEGYRPNCWFSPDAQDNGFQIGSN
jgi:hypothetical protein